MRSEWKATEKRLANALLFDTVSYYAPYVVPYLYFAIEVADLCHHRTGLKCTTE